MNSTIFIITINANIGLCVRNQRWAANSHLHLLPATKTTLNLSVRWRRRPSSSAIHSTDI